MDLEQLILNTIEHGEIADTYIFAKENNIDHQVIVGVIKSLLVDAYVIDEPVTNSFWVVTDEGNVMAEKGSPEYQVFQAVPVDGINVVELQNQLKDICKIGLGQCMKNKWLKKDGDMIKRVVDNVNDETSTILSALNSLNLTGNGTEPKEDDMKNFKRRKLVNQIVRKSLRITRGPAYRVKRVRKMADLTKDMLGTKSEVNKYLINYI
jgi:phenylalanyl-tRNA synthetase alpha chain